MDGGAGSEHIERELTKDEVLLLYLGTIVAAGAISSGTITAERLARETYAGFVLVAFQRHKVMDMLREYANNPLVQLGIETYWDATRTVVNDATSDA